MPGPQQTVEWASLAVRGPTRDNDESNQLQGGYYDITANDTWEDVGVSVTLPAAGTYLLFCQCQAVEKLSAGNGGISARLYNTTDSAAVAGSEVLVIYSDTTSYLSSTSVGVALLTVDSTKSIKMQAKRLGNTPTWVTSRIYDTDTGKTKIVYVRIDA